MDNNIIQTIAKRDLNGSSGKRVVQHILKGLMFDKVIQTTRRLHDITCDGRIVRPDDPEYIPASANETENDIIAACCSFFDSLESEYGYLTRTGTDVKELVLEAFFYLNWILAKEPGPGYFIADTACRPLNQKMPMPYHPVTILPVHHLRPGWGIYNDSISEKRYTEEWIPDFPFMVQCWDIHKQESFTVYIETCLDPALRGSEYLKRNAAAAACTFYGTGLCVVYPENPNIRPRSLKDWNGALVCTGCGGLLTGSSYCAECDFDQYNPSLPKDDEGE